MKNRPQKPNRGFTIMELMVAMAITTIIVTILISITSISLETWNRSRSEVRAARQAQAMTEIMARDFEAMVVRPGNNFEWLIAESSEQVGPAANRSPNSANIVFFTAATDRYEGRTGTPEDLGGDISTVGYSLRFNDPINAAGANFETFVLYRKLVNPDETFRGAAPLLGQTDLKAAFATYQNDIEEMANFVCENIHQFSVILHIESFDETTLMHRTIPVTLTQVAGSSVRVFGNRMELTPANPLVGESGRITAVEISITVLSDNAMNAMRGSATISDDFIRKNSYQYSKRIEVPRT
ncbi:MAG: type II secretion system protein J [Luteolibacter sp.]